MTNNQKSHGMDRQTEERMRANFSKQGFLIHSGAFLGKVKEGEVEIILPFCDQVNQHHGFFHGGAIATIADSASGAATQTLLDENASVLTTEFKINFVAPAVGEQLVARGRVIKHGKTLTICQSDVFSQTGDRENIVEKLVATALLTMMSIPNDKIKGTNDVSK